MYIYVYIIILKYMMHNCLTVTSKSPYIRLVLRLYG